MERTMIDNSLLIDINDYPCNPFTEICDEEVTLYSAHTSFQDNSLSWKNRIAISWNTLDENIHFNAEDKAEVLLVLLFGWSEYICNHTEELENLDVGDLKDLIQIMTKCVDDELINEADPNEYALPLIICSSPMATFGPKEALRRIKKASEKACQKEDQKEIEELAEAYQDQFELTVETLDCS